MIKFYERKNDNGIKNELQQKIKENWKEYNYKDEDINTYIESIFSIIKSDNLDKFIFPYELKSEKVTITLDNAIFSTVLSQISKNFYKNKYCFYLQILF